MKTATEYLQQAAQLLGYPDVDCIGNSGELDRAGRIAHALIDAQLDGFKEGVDQSVSLPDKSIEDLKL